MSGGYSNLSVAPGVDITQVSPALLGLVNDVLKNLGVIGTVISGYRTPAHSVAVGGFANDPHTQGRALDIYVNGTPIGKVPGAMAALTAAGIVSGNQPNFFKGSPDPAHVQLGGAAGAAPRISGGPAQASATSAAGTGCLPAVLIMFAVGTCIIVEGMLHFVH